MPANRQIATIHKAAELWTTVMRGGEAQLTSIRDAALAVDKEGRVAAVGRAVEFKNQNAESSIEVIDHGAGIIVPGFVDTHVHCPQIDVMGCGGYPLLSWLDQFVFPREAKFSDATVATDAARRLTRELIHSGVTTAAVFSTSHAAAADILFAQFESAGLRLISGKTSMDVGAPTNVLQSARADIEDQETLIKKWHGRAGRLFYAITPRFALSCSREMMRALGDLRERHRGLYVQSHISETRDEVETVRSVWKDAADYLAVYADHGLLGERCVFAHGIYLTDSELDRMAGSKTSLAHCPTSNLFLGSGLLNLKRTLAAGVVTGLASDVGAGTSFSPWATMLEAYKVQALQGNPVSGAQLLYLATQGGADALALGHETGSLEVGKRADFVVIDPARRSLLSERLAVASSPEERLFSVITLGDDRVTAGVYVNGLSCHA
jgi:guanine deaminase